MRREIISVLDDIVDNFINLGEMEYEIILILLVVDMSVIGG